MNLSAHFTLAEFTHSQIAARMGLDNMPGTKEIAAMQRVAVALELIRKVIGAMPIIVTSGYRSPAVNAAAYGSADSAHMRGAAVDFIIPSFGTPFQVCQSIISMGLPFDQLIYEHTWVHLAIEPPTRRQVLTKKRGAPGYLSGLVEFQA